MENTGHLLSTLIFLPLGGAILVAFLPRNDGLAKWAALVTALVDFVLSVPLFVRFDSATHEMQFVERLPWIVSFNIQYAVGVDGISLLLVLLTTLLMPLSVLCSWRSIEKSVKEFMITLLVMESAMIGVFTALDFILFYVFWEAMLIPMYLIIGVWGGPNRIYAAIKFFLYTLAGSLLLLVAILVLYFTGGKSFDILALTQQHYSPTVQFWAFWAFFLAFAIKVPMFPFHTWLPDAHVEAPTAGSVILAGLLLKMGGYGFLRICLPMVPQASQSYAGVVLALSIVAILYGACMTLAQWDLKKLIAYSSISHMGFVTLGIFVMNTEGIEGALLQMINHGITTGALFLAVGQLYDRTHSRMIDDYGGIVRPMPKFASLLTLFAMASFGMPGTGNFVSEFLVLVGASLYSLVIAVLAIGGVLLAAAYLLWMVRRIALGELRKLENAALPDLDLREMVTMVPLVILVFWIGFHPNPVLSVMHASVRHLLSHVR